MKSTNINFRVPPSLKNRLARRAASKFKSVTEYLVYLICTDLHIDMREMRFNEKPRTQLINEILGKTNEK